MTDDTKKDDAPAEGSDEPGEDLFAEQDAEREPRAADAENESEVEQEAAGWGPADAEAKEPALERPAAVAKPGRRGVILALGAGLLVGAGAGAGGMYLWGPRRRRSGGPRGPELKRSYVEVAPWNPRRGPNPAKVTIVEFSDFQ
jgi:hypothetical protein